MYLSCLRPHFDNFVICRVNVGEMPNAIYFQDFFFPDLDKDFNFKDWQSGRKKSMA